MPLQQVEFEFPDEADKKTKFAAEIEVVDDDEPMDLKIDGPVGRETVAKPNKKKDNEEFEVEIVDDTPQKDRGKKPSSPPEAVTDEELDNYSDKVRKRIQHFSRGYHDERRAKEQAFREREALEEYTRKIMEENQQLKGSVDKGHNALIESAKKQVLGEVSAAKQKYKEAYDSGDTDKIVSAQEVLNAAQIRMDKVNGLKPRAAVSTNTPLQTKPNPVQRDQIPSVPRQQVPTDTKAEAWREENSWFGSDDEMTAYALGYHSKIVKTGVDPQSDEYYEQINSRMRKMFPDQFNNSDIEDEPEAPRQRRTTNVVAPATRSTAPRKVRLTESQVAIARKLGVPLESYAKQVANLQRKG
jgi:hypothetical protein